MDLTQGKKIHQGKYLVTVPKATKQPQDKMTPVGAPKGKFSDSIH